MNGIVTADGDGDPLMLARTTAAVCAADAVKVAVYWPPPLAVNVVNDPADVDRDTDCPDAETLLPAESRSWTVMVVEPDPAAIDEAAAVTRVWSGSTTPVVTGLTDVVADVRPVLVIESG